MQFDPRCTRCPRLAQFLEDIRRTRPEYFCRPVPPFGAASPKLLIVGLAPGLHGANRTGRPFTGDFAGILLYESLHKFGLATAAMSVAASDSLQLLGARITNAVKCVPPGNKPLPAEIITCNQYLAAEISALPGLRVALALGRIAHEAVLRAVSARRAAFSFGHAAEHRLPSGLLLLDSYHCSRYNTQTRRLTREMFESVVQRAAEAMA
jgi:uracil-DNA glycosylase